MYVRLNADVISETYEDTATGKRQMRSHRRRFVPDCENFKIATKSQYILTILCPSSSWKQIGNQNISGRKFQHVDFFADFAECPDLIRNRHLSVFISVCPSLSQSILVYR